MIIITGAAGFIGSCMVAKLNENGYDNLILVDNFFRDDKRENWLHKNYTQVIDRNNFITWFKNNTADIEAIIHLGARTDTTETDIDLFNRLNLNYTKSIWTICAKHNIPLIYASSAATYGNGELGYKDDHALCEHLKPLNAYGDSKNDFDIWALKQDKQPPFWAGLKFFNVYGSNEYHKGRMASVIFHTVQQINKTGGMRLFRSHRPDFKDGEQMRDFIYVKDVVNVCLFLMKEQPKSGLYNLGTGKARTFYDLAKTTFLAMGLEPNISFMDTPKDLREKYQYFTEADMTKLKNAGYTQEFYSLEAGITEYVQEYLIERKIW